MTGARIVGAAGLVAMAGLIAGAAAIANHARASPTDPVTISPAEAARMGLIPESVRQRGRFTAASGTPFSVYVGRDSDKNLECIILVGGGGSGGGCDRTLFAYGPIAFVEAASGGPAKTKRTDFELAGVVADSVARLDVVDSLGRVTRIDTSANKAFFFELKPGDLARGVGATTLVARDASGATITSVDVSEPGP
jgi:hypothetical protein